MTLREERTKIFHDILAGRIPKRVPVYMSFEASYPILYAGYNLAVDQYNMDIVKDAIDKTLTDFPTDNMPTSVSTSAITNKIYGSKKFIPSPSGFFQHPNLAAMEDSEYDEFIADPYKFIIEKGAPRVYENLTPEKRGMALFKANVANQYIARRTAGMNEYLAEKHQLGDAFRMMGGATAPFDYLGDNLRAFTGCLNDIRRYPEKVLEAVEAITEMEIADLARFKGMNIPSNGILFSALHMPTFMRTSDFEKFWFPSYVRYSKAINEAGLIHLMFCEDDWNRYVNHLTQIPKRNVLVFEKMDPRLAKDVLGKDYVLAGFYPIINFTTLNPDEAVDEAKKVLDIAAPGGNYMFRTDKAPIRETDIRIESFRAVADYVMNHTDY